MTFKLATLKEEMSNSRFGIIRKITIGRDYVVDAMHYSVGQSVYGGHSICDIVDEGEAYTIYVKIGDEVKCWKEFNKNMAVSVEYSME